MSQYWSQLVNDLEPYVPGEQPKVLDLIKLNTNENPYPPSPRVREAIDDALVDSLRLYPDPNSQQLRKAIASYNGVDYRQVFVGNGSDEVLALGFMAFFKDKPLLFPDISYSFYPVYCQLFDIEAVRVPLRADFSIDLTQYTQRAGNIIFPNPNAPTGIGLPLDAIEALLQAVPEKLVVVDEAYVDFGAQSAAALIQRYPNVLVVQTLSKSRSLAGLRLGFALGNPELIEGLERVKNSFNSYPIDRIAEKAAVAALADTAYFEQCCNKIIATREWTIQQLEALGFETLPSQANFIFTRHSQQQAAALFRQLREKKIIVRYFNKPRIDQYLRITIGTRESMEKLVAALAAIVGSN